jgi:hypothetical protein
VPLLDRAANLLRRGMQHGDLDKTNILKTQRDYKSDEQKPNFTSVLKSILPVRLVLHTG